MIVWSVSQYLRRLFTKCFFLLSTNFLLLLIEYNFWLLSRPLLIKCNNNKVLFRRKLIKCSKCIWFVLFELIQAVKSALTAVCYLFKENHTPIWTANNNNTLLQLPAGSCWTGSPVLPYNKQQQCSLTPLTAGWWLKQRLHFKLYLNYRTIMWGITSYMLIFINSKTIAMLKLLFNTCSSSKSPYFCSL